MVGYIIAAQLHLAILLGCQLPQYIGLYQISYIVHFTHLHRG